MTCHEVGRLLDAYIDNEIALAESASLQEHRTSCVACSRRVAERESLGRLVRGLPYHGAPHRLRAAITTVRTRPQSGPRRLALAAVVTMGVSLGGLTTVRMVRARQTVDTTATIVEGLVDSHVRALMADHLFDVRSTDQHTVKPWFLGRLDSSPPVEDLASVGFPLVGGRLDYVAGRPAATLIYQRRQHAINLFVWPESSGTMRENVRSTRGFQLRHWSSRGMSFWAISDLNHAELAAFERALHSKSTTASNGTTAVGEHYQEVRWTP
ncbi:MAG TPA: anti-sigma factor [Vicinamibacterales bacterium]|nr:anti-sigma factor [Vicinamibacterales bacterium]